MPAPCQDPPCSARRDNRRRAASRRRIFRDRRWSEQPERRRAASGSQAHQAGIVADIQRAAGQAGGCLGDVQPPHRSVAPGSAASSGAAIARSCSPGSANTAGTAPGSGPSAKARNSPANRAAGQSWGANSDRAAGERDPRVGIAANKIVQQSGGQHRVAHAVGGHEQNAHAAQAMPQSNTPGQPQRTVHRMAPAITPAITSSAIIPHAPPCRLAQPIGPGFATFEQPKQRECRQHPGERRPRPRFVAKDL